MTTINQEIYINIWNTIFYANGIDSIMQRKNDYEYILVSDGYTISYTNVKVDGYIYQVELD